MKPPAGPSECWLCAIGRRARPQSWPYLQATPQGAPRTGPVLISLHELHVSSNQDFIPLPASGHLILLFLLRGMPALSPLVFVPSWGLNARKADRGNQDTFQMLRGSGFWLRCSPAQLCGPEQVHFPPVQNGATSRWGRSTWSSPHSPSPS